MTSTIGRVRGWAAASQACGIATRTLRRLHADGVLPDHGKDERGVWLFDLGDLDRLRDRLGTAPADVATWAPSDQSVRAATASQPLDDYPDPVAIESEAPPTSDQLPPWMLAASAEQSDRAPAPEPTTGLVEPSPWGVRTGPTWLDTIGNEIARARPPAAVEQLAHERDAARAEAEQLRALLVHAQRQVADLQQHAQLQVAQVQHHAQHSIAGLQAQVAQATANWAGERVAAIALSIECELLHSAALVGLTPQKVNAAVERARNVAVGAITRLDDGQLADPSALDIARSAAHAALAKLQARANRRRKHDADGETSAN